MFMLERLISVVAPHNCLVCGVEGSLVCAWCKPGVPETVPSRCFRCHTSTTDYATCAKCRRQSPLKHVWVSSEYTALPKKLVRSFKFERAQAAAPIIAEYMHELMPFLSDILLVPVPTASSRLRYRGYDHIKLLTKQLSKTTNLPYDPALTRQGQSRQVGAKRNERLAQLSGSFRVVHADIIKHAKILLVDDVLTTGTTLSEVAKTLKQAGAKEVNAVVFAQTR
jgi:ComF family protein